MPKISEKIQLQVRERANHCCEYCLALGQFAFSTFTVDHIIAISKGGTDDLGNLAWACSHCNNCKYNRLFCIDPLSKIKVPLFNPRKNNWSEHFIWNKNQTIIIGVSSIGRATINCLKVNRQEAVNLRGALRVFGVHPPRISK